MGSKIKNFFFNFNRLKKPAVLAAVFFCLFLGLALPLSSAQAFVQLIGIWVAACVVSLAMQLALAFTTILLLIASVILSWVLSPYFIDIPYTALFHRGAVTIVGVGWPIVRDFANMFFIIILAIIGLATALRLSDYQAKKALPKLVLIALLINFTPVMCGLIIDASNIVMNFFLEELTGLRLLSNQLSAQGALVLQSLAGCINPLNALPALSKTIVMMIFNLVTAFIFLMYALLFIMRYVMLWMLVILSPFAFFTMLLAPGTRKTLSLGLLDWDEWWKNFVQWCIIGVTGAFFLYLGEQMMVIFSEETITLAAPGDWIGWLSLDFLGEILQYLVVLAFLIVGFSSAISTSAMGAGFITGTFKKYGTMGASMAGAWASRRGLAAARGIVPQGLRTRLEGMAASKGPAWGTGRRGAAGYALRTAAGTVGFLQGRAAGAAVSAVIGGEKTAASKATKEAKERDVIGNLNALRDATISEADRMGIIRGMMEAKQMRDALNEDVVGDKKLTEEEASNAYKKARQLKDRDATEDMEWSFAHMKDMPEKMAALVDQETASNKDEKDRTGGLYGRASGLSEDDVKLYGYTSYKDKIIRSAKSVDDMKKFSKGLWKQKDAIESALYFDSRQIGAATTQFGRAFSDNIQTAAEEKGVRWFYDVNPLTGKMRAPKLPKYLQSNTAQGTYMPLAGAENRTEVQKLEKEGREKQKPFLERQLRAAETAGNAAEASRLRGDIIEIERLEKEERERIVVPPPGEEEPIAAKINRLREQEEVAKKALDRMKIWGRPKEVIEKAEADLQAIRETKTMWEGAMAVDLREQGLDYKLKKARERQEKIEGVFGNIKRETGEAQDKIEMLNQDRRTADDQLHSLENRLREEIVPQFLEANPELGTKSRKFKNAMKQKIKEIEAIPEMEERAVRLEEIQKDPELKNIRLGSRDTRKGIEADPEIAQVREKIKETGDKLKTLDADIRQESKALKGKQKEKANLEKLVESEAKNIETIEDELKRIEKINIAAPAEEDKEYLKLIKKKEKKIMKKFLEEEREGKT